MRLIAITALLLLGVAGPALAETNVGVTAAVNQDAKGIVGSSVKTISLGDSVVFNQRIQTGGGGLVQVLLADGTTFMVGPNSDLVIDSFVYDPNAGTAQVTASFTKGVLRFIGGQTSKTENGVTINTPVGTMGIRGAMVDVVLDPPAGTPPHIDMLFGNEVTLEQGKALLGRLYAAGYSLALGQGGTFEVLKTPPGWGSQIQAALAGAAGTKGGAPKGPSDGDVKNSEIAENNSGNGVGDNTPGNPPLSKEELDALLYAAAHYDELREFLLNNQHPEGFVGGMFTGEICSEGCYVASAPGDNDYDVNYDGDSYELAGYDPVFAEFAFDSSGNPVRIKASFLTSAVTGCYDEGCSLVYEGDGESGTLTATLGENQTLVRDTTNNLLIDHDDPSEDNPLTPELSAQLDCSDCEAFIRWGFWGFTAGDVPLDGQNTDVDFLGAWVAGDLTTSAQLNTLANASESNINATYRGDAVGVVNNGGEQYVATGDMAMTWNFGARHGDLEITDFDGDRDIYYGDISSPGAATGFVGFVSCDCSVSGQVQGAFVNDGPEGAGGVMGNWSYQDYYDDPYSVSGVFMGTRGPDVPIDSD
jgi:hypothetical protein